MRIIFYELSLELFYIYCRSHIPLRNSDDEASTIIYFPVPCDSPLTLQDLRSAFQNASSLRYQNEGDERQHHILCRENVFVDPEGGWQVPGRIYLVVNHIAGQNSRYGIFESYRKQIASKGTSEQNQSGTEKNAKKKKEQQNGFTTIYVGNGHFKNGVFMKITSLSLTGCGGLVSVGPFPKTSNVSKEIRDAAFEKFAAQNRFVV